MLNKSQKITFAKILSLMVILVAFVGVAFNMVWSRRPLGKTTGYLTSNGGITGVILLGGEQLKVVQALPVGEEPEEVDKITFGVNYFTTDKEYNYDVRIRNTEKAGGSDSKFIRWKWIAEIDGVEENINKYIHSNIGGTKLTYLMDDWFYLVDSNYTAAKLAPGEDISILNTLLFHGEFDEDTLSYGSVLDKYFSGSDIQIYLYIEGSTDNGAEDAWEITTPAPYLTFLESDDYVTVTDYSGTEGNVVIPSTFNGKPVTSIADGAFETNATAVTSLTIPGSVKTVGNLSNFQVDIDAQTYSGTGLPNLTSLTLEEGIETIGECAFPLSKLSSVTIPSSVETIDTGAFAMAMNLNTVDFAEKSQLTTIGAGAFYYCASLQNITIPEPVTTIEFAAFAVTGLTNIIIPEAVTSIGQGAFCDCANLKTVIFDGNSKLTAIERTTFVRCTSLKTIKIPSGVTSIGEFAFQQCSSLETVIFDKNSQLISIETYAFNPCISLTSIILPENLTSIGDDAFGSCETLTTITIPSSVTSIGKNAFVGCFILNTVNFANKSGWKAGSTPITVAELEDTTLAAAYLKSANYTYYNKVWTRSDDPAGYLTFEETATEATVVGYNGTHENVVIPATYNGKPVTAMADASFETYATTVKSLTIPGSVKTVGNLSNAQANFSTGEYSGTGLPNLTSLTLEEGIETIGDLAFPTGITEVTIPNSVTTIGNGAFGTSLNLRRVLFKSNSQLTSIGIAAFFQCENLQSITIPERVTSIASAAFQGCTALTEINFNAVNMNDLAVNNYAFASAGGEGTGITVNFGANVEKVPACLFCPTMDEETLMQGAFVNIATVNFLGNQVETIGEGAFAYCMNLNSLTIPYGVTTIGAGAFVACLYMTTLTIPESVTRIGESAFISCLYLTEINYNAVNANDLEFSNMVFAFAGLMGLQEGGTGVTLNIGANVERIPANMFCPNSDVSTLGEMFPGITSVNFLGNKVTSIGDFAFASLLALTSITIPESVTSIGTVAFGAMMSLTEINFNAVNVADFAEDSAVFALAGGENSGVTVNIGANVTKVPACFLFCQSDMFGDMDLTPSITAINFLGNKVTTIGMGAFILTSITTITIPESVNSIGMAAFGGCLNLSTANFENKGVWFAGETLISETKLEDTTIAANYLKETYVEVEWTRSDANTYLCLSYIETATEVIIVGYDGTQANVVIPATINGKPVTNIADGAFEDGASAVTSLTIPGSVNTVGNLTNTYLDSGFVGTGFANLTSLTLQEGIQNIGDFVFMLSPITEVTIPSSMKTIGGSAFMAAQNLATVTISQNSQLTSIGDMAFVMTGLTSITIPETVTTIGKAAFGNCENLSTVTFEGDTQLTSIEYQVFAESGITEITIPKSVTSIGNMAFYWCYNLSTVRFEEGSQLTSIGDYAFQMSSGLTEFEMPSGVTSIGGFAFDSCGSLTTITIPSSVISIGNFAFQNCGNLGTVIFDDKSGWTAGSTPIAEADLEDTTLAATYLKTTYYDVEWKKYGYLTFQEGDTEVTVTGYDGSVGNVIIPATYNGKPVTAIADGAFEANESAVTSLTIPESVTSIASAAFQGCTALTEINFNATNLADLEAENMVFTGAGTEGTGITVNFGANVEKVPAYLFCPTMDEEMISQGGIANVTAVNFLGNKVTEIGMGAFAYCTNLTSITIPESVTTIGMVAFAYCSALTEINFNATNMTDLASGNWVFFQAGQSGDGIAVNIGANVTKIPAYLFSDVSKITSVVWAEGSVCESIGNSVFLNCDDLTTITIPSSVTSIGRDTFGGCTNLGTVRFEEGSQLTSIGEYAFYGTDLSTVNFGTKSGWTAGSTPIAVVDLENTTLAATYLKSTYCTVAWTRS